MADTIESLLAANRSGNLLSAIANPPSVNPLAAVNSAADAVRSRYAVQQMGANAAAGRAYQAATDPVTGQVDTGKAQAIIAADPNAALAAQTTATSGQQLQQAQQTRSSQASTSVNAGIASMMALPDARQTRDGYTGLINQLVAGGSISQHDAQAAMQDMPQSDNPSDWRMYATRHLVHNLGGADVASRVLPQIGSLNTGGAMVGTVQQPQLGSSNPGALAAAPGGVGMTLSPEAVTAPTQIGVNPAGAPIFGTRGDFIQRAGGALPGGMPGGGGQVPTPAGLPPSLRNPARAGGAPGASAPGAAPAPGASAAPPGAPGGGIVMGVGPQQQAALSAAGTDSNAHFTGIANAGAQAVQQGAILSNMQAESKNFPIGPTKTNEVKAWMQRYAPGVAGAFGVKPDEVAANQSFDKLAAQIQDAQGAGSDARLAVIQKANPSSANTPEAIDLILRQLQGNADYLKARAGIAAKWDRSDRAGFDTEVGYNLNPQVFQYQRLTPQQKTTFYNALPSDPQNDEKTRFRADYSYAQSKGLVGGR